MITKAEKEYKRGYRQEHKKEIKEYKQKYNKHHKKQINTRHRENYHKHPEQHRVYCRNYRKYHHTLAENSKNKWRIANLQKFRAQHIASRRVPLASCCANCKGTENLERHHLDYSKPLEVVTLCKQCHETRHFKGETGFVNPNAEEIRYLDGIDKVTVLIRGSIPDSSDLRFWRVQFVSTGYTYDVYPARVHVESGRSKVRRLLTK